MSKIEAGSLYRVHVAYVFLYRWRSDGGIRRSRVVEANGGLILYLGEAEAEVQDKTDHASEHRCLYEGDVYYFGDDEFKYLTRVM